MSQEVDVTEKNFVLPQLLSWGDGVWRSEAACRGLDTNTFFPERGKGSTAEKVAESKIICMRCPVRIPCLQFALDNNLEHGTYGGVPPHDRRGMKNITVTYDTVKVHIKEAHKVLLRAKVNDSLGTLAQLLGKSKDWVRKELSRGNDHFI